MGPEESRLTNAVYFNLERGLYTVIVEVEGSQWIDVKTIVVDHWTTSVVSLGSSFVR